MPEIYITPVVSDNVSPAISGTISNKNLKVMVEIGGESHLAIVNADGSWSIPEGTFANLHEGIYDIVASALLGSELVAVDNSLDELQIKLPQVVFTMDSAVFNTATPMLRGTVSDPQAELELQIEGKKYQGNVDASGNWELAGLVPDPLLEGYHVIVLKFSQITGNELFFHESLLIDLTPPMVVGSSPNAVKVTSQPVLFLKFTENVFPGEGKLIIFRSGTGQQQSSLQANSGMVRGWGSKELEINLEGALPSGTDFFLSVDNQFAKDGSGNFFAGITGNNAWQFSVLNSGEPHISKISSTSNSPLLEKGLLHITIEFSEAVSLRDGNINFTLETGVTDAILSHLPFENQDTIQLSYNIAQGDYASVLEVTSVFLQNTAALTSVSSGKNAALNVDVSNRLSKYSQIKVDGIPLDVKLLSPELGSVAFHSGVTYNTNKNLSSASLIWKSDQDVNGNTVETVEWSRTLSGEELKAGIHTNVGIEQDLPSGRIYNLVFSALDSNNSTLTLVWPQITMMPDIAEIEIAPKSGKFPLGEHITFRVFPHSFNQSGEDTIIIDPIDEGILWRLKGPGSIENGFFEARGLGEVEIIAEYAGLNAVANVTVYQANLDESPDSNGIVKVGDNLQLKLSHSTDLVLPSRVNILEDASLPPGIQPVGTSLHFSGSTEAIEEILFNFEEEGQTQGLQSYASTGDGIWQKVPSQLSEGWLAIKVSEKSFSQFVNGIDTLPPTVRIINGIVEAMEDHPVTFAYIAEDNILNPQLTIELCQGGANKEILEPLQFVSGKSSTWEIPGEYVTRKGLNFSLILSDGNEYSRTPSIGVEVIGNKNWSPSEKLKPDVYQMFSLPGIIANNKVQDVLTPVWGRADRSKWRLYQYNGSFLELSEGSRLNPGKAYWVNMKEVSPVLNLKAGSFKSANISTNFSISLHDGWNTIANPYSYPIPVKALLDSNLLPELIIYRGVEDNFQLMDSGDSLRPWEGYLLWNGKEGKLWAEKFVFPWHWAGPNLSPKTAMAKSGFSHYRGSLTFNSSNASLTFGTFGQDSPINSRLTLSTPALGKKPDYYWIKDSSSQKFQLDFFPHDENGNHWVFQGELKGQKGVSINLELTRQLPEGHRAYIFQRTGSKLYSFEGEPLTLKISNAELEIQEFVLIVGTEDYSKQLKENFAGEVRELNLLPSYPNPFVYQTHIPIKIPSWANFNELDITMEIYSYSGKKIKNLKRGRIHAGTHILSWDGRDSRGILMPSGTYLCRFSAKGHGSWVQKLVLSR